MTYIVAIGTSSPTHTASQMDIARMMTDQMLLSDEEAWLVEKIYKNSAIQQRYSVLPYLLQGREKNIGMSERNQIYKIEAPVLALTAAKKALDNWKRPHKDITHIITVSCTGAITPGLEFILARELDLNPSVSLLGVNFMGCYGSFKAFKIASKIVKENPQNRVLIVSCELCSLHMKSGKEIESLVIQSLFADGAAAVIIGSKPIDTETPLLEILQEASYMIKDTEKEMTWDAGDNGFDMTLTQRVPRLIQDHIKVFVNTFLDNLDDFSSYDWAVHPGGKAILESVEKALHLPKELTLTSWNILKNFGNMSSASIIFVLEDLLKNGTDNKKAIALGFGPGLVVEGLLINKTH